MTDKARFGKEYVRNLVDYVRRYPSFFSEIMKLHESYDLSQVREFLEKLDLGASFVKSPEHKGYIKHKSEIDQIITASEAYSIQIDVLDQDYMDDEHMRKVYTDAAGSYDEVVNTFWPFGRDEAMSWLDPRPGERILEIGTGPGSNFGFYPDHCEVVGIDFSEGMIDAARKRAEELGKSNIIVHLMDAHKTTFADSSFDKVYSFYALCVMRNPFRVTKEIQRICKPNGRLVMFEPIKSEIEEVGILQYLFQPVGSRIGHVWITNFPAYRVPYNAYLRAFDILRELGLSVDKDTAYDPPFNIVHMIQCTNRKGELT